MIVRDLLFRLGLQVNRRSFQQAEQGVRNIGRSAQASTKSIGGMSMGLTAMMGAVGGITALIAGGKWLVGSIASIETLKTSLITVTGSAEAASEAFDRLQKFAAETPFQLETVVTSFRKLKSFGLDPSQRALTAYGNIASATTGSLEQFVEAAADASVGQFERLLEFGIKANKKGKDIEFTFKGLKTTVKNDSKAIQEYLINIGETDFAGGMERQSKTLGGMLSTMKDGAVQFAVAVGEAGLLDALKELMTLLMASGKGGGGLAKVLGFILSTSVRYLTRTLDALFRIGTAVKEAIVNMIPDSARDSAGEWGDKLKFIGKILFGLVTPILLIEDFIAFMQGRDSVIGDFVNQLKDADNIFGTIARALLWLRDGGGVSGDLGNMWDVAKAKALEFWETVKSIYLDIWTRIQPLIKFIVAGFQIIKKGVMTFFGLLNRIARPIRESLVNIITYLIEKIQELAPYFYRARDAAMSIINTLARILELIKRLWDALTETEAFQTASEFIGQVWDGIVGGIETAVKAIIDVIGEMFKFFVETFEQTDELLSTFADNVVGFFEGIPAALKGSLSAVITWLEDAINTAIGIVNDMIDIANEVGVDIDRISTVSFSGADDKSSAPGTDGGFGGGFFRQFESAPAQTIQPNLSVSGLSVNVSGTTDMGPDALAKATQTGTEDALNNWWNQAGRSFESGVR